MAAVNVTGVGRVVERLAVVGQRERLDCTGTGRQLYRIAATSGHRNRVDANPLLGLLREDDVVSPPRDAVDVGEGAIAWLIMPKLFRAIGRRNVGDNERKGVPAA